LRRLAAKAALAFKTEVEKLGYPNMSDECFWPFVKPLHEC